MKNLLLVFVILFSVIGCTKEDVALEKSANKQESFNRETSKKSVGQQMVDANTTFSYVSETGILTISREGIKETYKFVRNDESKNSYFEKGSIDGKEIALDITDSNGAVIMYINVKEGSRLDYEYVSYAKF
jgi:hypothetical protein